MSNLYINENKFAEVKKLVIFVENAKIISYKQAVTFLKNLGLNENRIERVLNIVKQKRFVNFTPTNGFLYSNSLSGSNNAMQYFAQVDKINWLYIDLIKHFELINYDCKYPCKAFMYNSDNENCACVFYVRNDFIDDDCNNIEINYATQNTKNSPVDSIILIDNKDEISKIFLSKSFNVLAFATINYNDDATTKITYYDINGNEMELANEE